MKKTTKIVSAAMATLMAASTLAVGSISVSAASLKKPTKVKAVNVTKGIKITWKKVKGAKKYQVFRGKKKIKTLSKKTYTDKKAKAGKTYKYYVKALKGKKKSKKSKAAKVVRLTKPTVSSVKNIKSGSAVSWKKVKGAKKYYVYSGSKKIATTTKLNYTYTKVASGKTYSYKVKAVNGKSTSVASAAKKGMFLSAPQVKVTVAGNKATLTWNKVNGASEYEVKTATTADKNMKSAGKVKTTSFEIDLGANPTMWGFTVSAINGSAVSANGEATYAYIPEGCYFTDKDGNLHVKIALKKGEDYKDGSYLTKLLAGLNNTDYAVTVDEESAKVVSAKDGVITGVAAGEGTVFVELKTEAVQKTIYTLVCDITEKKFGNELKTGKVYVDVTVAE